MPTLDISAPAFRLLPKRPCHAKTKPPHIPMISRSHLKNDAQSTAQYSDCQRFRYALTRIWQPDGPRLLFVMLNPSTATEVQNDPTVERCERRARALGFGGFRVCNIFAWRDTDPRNMRTAKDPIGPENDQIIHDACQWADQIICAWGTHGAHLQRGPAVETLMRASCDHLFHLGLSKAGHPKHPLYIAYAEQPRPWVTAL